jgi:IS605 OrfB family transposase
MKDLTERGYTLTLDGARINKDETITFFYTKPLNIYNGKLNLIKSVGVDLGRDSLVACSDGNKETTHATGKMIKEILYDISRKRSGSKNLHKSIAFLRNEINYSLKHDINWARIDNIVIENLKDMKRNKKWGKQSHYWPVGYVRTQLKNLSRENGDRLTEVNAAYTSQECNVCGFIHKNNRNNERFLCMNCGNEIDADYNASINIYNRGMNSSSAKWNIISICNMNLRKIINTYEKNNYK